MSNSAPSELPDPATAPELFEGVLTRRVFAYFVDFVILVMISSVIAFVGLIAGFLTLGLGWLLIPVVLPIAILGYYIMTLGSPMRATVGMSLMDIVLVPARGYPLDGLAILVHPLVFWVTVWVAWPISLLVALLTPRQQMVQDLVTGTLMLRRSPMAQHWGSMRA
ncbi:MAG: RDD family protein [Devosia sp.]